jgi:oxygen-independent coproporphyrinogen-3 oxidase
MTEDRTALTPALIAEDSLLFGLRMNAGVDMSLLHARCPGAPWMRVEALMDRLADEGLAVRDGARVRLEPRGRLLADSIGTEIMVAFDRVAAAQAVWA